MHFLWHIIITQFLAVQAPNVAAQAWFPLELHL